MDTSYNKMERREFNRKLGYPELIYLDTSGSIIIKYDNPEAINISNLFYTPKNYSFKYDGIIYNSHKEYLLKMKYNTFYFVFGCICITLLISIVFGYFLKLL